MIRMFRALDLSRSMKTAAMIALLIGCAAIPAMARATPEEPPLRDDRPVWRIGVLPFAGTDLEPEDAWLARSIPLLMLETLSPLGEHRLSDAEREARRVRVLEKAQATAGRTLAEENRARDRLLLADLSDDVRADRREAADLRVTEARRALNRLLAMEADEVIVPVTRPIEFFGGGAELIPTGLARGQAASQHDLDLVLSGSVDRLDREFLVVEIAAYSVAQEREVYRDLEVIALDDIAPLVEAMVERVAETVLGRPWAHLTVVTNTPNAALLVDGELVGFGSATSLFLEPGSRRVVVSYESVQHQETVVLLPGRFERIDVALPQPQSGRVVVDSEPSGADVYVDSVWRGRTPVALNRPHHTATVLLQREGSLDSRFTIGPQTPDRVVRDLAPDIVGWTEQTTAARDRFYRALGFFVVSLPAPIILNGVYENLAVLYASGTPAGLGSSESDRLLATANTVYWGYWASVGVSSGLFANLVVQLVRYIRTAESYHFH
ncbi:MAG: PEGA domain-containing protein [Spirochaetaceae bacterium]|nr:MAG: PEGA domain-containing protein [Spirochaetaceae bacterium]